MLRWRPRPATRETTGCGTCFQYRFSVEGPLTTPVEPIRRTESAETAEIHGLGGGLPAGGSSPGLSPERLRLNEVTWPVPSLPVPDAVSSERPERLAQNDAVRLFVERARLVRHSFVLTAANAAAVGRITQRLDGLPLAIELAAARVRTMGPTEIEERLRDRFRLLTRRWPHFPPATADIAGNPGLELCDAECG
jgi:hypothetical protein